MKKLFWLLTLLPLLVSGQDKPVIVYGRVTSDYKNVDINKATGLNVRYVTKDNSYLTSPNTIKSDGYYTCKLEGAVSITIESNVHDFYAPSVTESVNGRDSIRIDLKLVPKPYVYTAAKAKEDLAANEVQIITYDTIKFGIGVKYDLKKNLGFTYLLIQKPDDRDFEENITQYNEVVAAYLDQAYTNWDERLSVVRDSIINLDADTYGKKKNINLSVLKVPELKKLPLAFAEKLTMWQDNYDHWYKEKLKNYSTAKTIETVKRDKDYKHLRLMLARISIEYETLIPELVKLITDKTEVGLEGFNGIMFCRGLAPTGLMGECVGIPYSTDDLYTISGRANYLLKLLTTEDFGNVLPDSTPKHLKKLQNRWAYWLLQLQDKK